MSASSTTPALAISPTAVAQEVGDDVVILNLDSGIYFSLNEVGALIWRGLERGDTRETIERDIAGEYEVAPAELGTDIHAFIETLLANGLVVAA